MTLAAFGSLLLALGCTPEPGDSTASDVETSFSALEIVYPAKLANCTACTGAGTYVDLNNGSVLKFLNVNGGLGSATLRFSMTSPSGVRKMGVFVNNTKVGTVSTTTVRPTFAEASVTATLPAGAANTVELRDTEGAAEPDVASLKVVTGGGGPVCGNSMCESGESCGSCTADCGSCGGGTRYEAENAATLQNAVKKPLASASGGQYVDGNAGARLHWTVTGTGSTQTIRFAASSPGGARSLRVTVNQGVVGVLTTSAPSFNWELKSFSAYLHAGTNNVDLWDLEGTAEPDLDYLEVLPSAPVTVTASAAVGGTIAPSGAVTVNQGGSKAFTFAPDANMRVKRICYPNATTCFAHSSTTWTLPNAAAGQTVKVEFEYVPGAACGDGICNNLEDLQTCAADCDVPVKSGRSLPNMWNNADWVPDGSAYYNQHLAGRQGATLGYQMTGSVAGWYKLSFSVTATSGTARMGVFLDSVKVGVVSTSATAGNWETVSVTAKLVGGVNNIELRDSEGASEFRIEYFDWHNNVFGTNAGGFALGWNVENGSWVYTEVVEQEYGSYLTPKSSGTPPIEGAWWIIDIHGYSDPGRSKYGTSATTSGFFLRDCRTGEWRNGDATVFAHTGDLVQDQGGYYDIQYYPVNAIVDSRLNPILLDANFACPGTSAPITAEITYQGGRRIVIADAKERYAVVVKHR